MFDYVYSNCGLSLQCTIAFYAIITPSRKKVEVAIPRLETRVERLVICGYRSEPSSLSLDSWSHVL